MPRTQEVAGSESLLTHTLGSPLPYSRSDLAVLCLTFQFSHLCCFLLSSILSLLIISVTYLCLFYINHSFRMLSSSQAFIPSPKVFPRAFACHIRTGAPPVTSFLKVLHLGFLTCKSDQQHQARRPHFCDNF